MSTEYRQKFSFMWSTVLATISHFLIILDQKKVAFWKMKVEIRAKLNYKYEFKTIHWNV